MEFIHPLGLSHNHRQRSKGFSPKISVQTSDDHTHALIGKHSSNLGDSLIEKLRFVNPNNRRG